MTRRVALALLLAACGPLDSPLPLGQRQSALQPVRPKLRVMTYNVGGKVAPPFLPPNVALTLARIAAEDPDVVLLQELPNDNWPYPHAPYSYLRDELDRMGMQRELNDSWRKLLYPDCRAGEAIYSRFPITSVRRQELSGWGTSAWLQQRRRGLLEVSAEVQGASLRLSTFHTAPPYTHWVNELARFIDGGPSDQLHVAGGDLNGNFADMPTFQSLWDRVEPGCALAHPPGPERDGCFNTVDLLWLGRISRGTVALSGYSPRPLPASMEEPVPLDHLPWVMELELPASPTAGPLSRGATPAVAVHPDGRAELFARGQNGSLHHATQLAPGGPFTAWRDLQTPIRGDPTALFEPSTQRVVVLLLQPDGQVAALLGSPLGYGLAEPIVGGTFFPTRLAAAIDGDGQLHVVARAGTGLQTAVATADGGFLRWSAWSAVPAAIARDFDAPTLLRRHDGALTLFFQCDVSRLCSLHFDRAARTWSGAIDHGPGGDWGVSGPLAFAHEPPLPGGVERVHVFGLTLQRIRVLWQPDRLKTHPELRHAVLTAAAHAPFSGAVHWTTELSGSRTPPTAFVDRDRQLRLLTRTATGELQLLRSTGGWQGLGGHGSAAPTYLPTEGALLQINSAGDVELQPLPALTGWQPLTVQ
jgi:endonuclease/exonuclease/phosphatase family metal-dependent hydrolase